MGEQGCGDTVDPDVAVLRAVTRALVGEASLDGMLAACTAAVQCWAGADLAGLWLLGASRRLVPAAVSAPFAHCDPDPRTLALAGERAQLVADSRTPELTEMTGACGSGPSTGDHRWFAGHP